MNEPTRAVCPRCRRTVLQRHDGLLRAHRPVPGSGPWCPGSRRAATIPNPAEGEPAVTDSNITFLCLTNTDNGMTAKTFVAVRTADRESLVRDMFGGAELEMWFVDFPGLAELAAAELANSGKDGAVLGTAVEGEWTSWYPPVPAPEVPAVA